MFSFCPPLFTGEVSSARFWPMTEGSLFAHRDPSVSRITNTKGVMLEPPTARRAVVSYFAGEANVKNTVPHSVLEAREYACWTVFLKFQLEKGRCKE